MKESDLYSPLKQFLTSQKYAVKGEINECDVIAVRGEEEPVVVELKLSLNLTVILQAVDRLSLSSFVYIGVPQHCKSLNRQRKKILKLLRMLGLGLILINPDKKTNNVTVLLDPGEYSPRKSKHRKNRLLGEFQKRVGDPNSGGSEKKSGIVTAYRQQALSIAEYLSEHGPTKASLIAASLEEPKTRAILYKNVYGWFERVSRGVYELSPRGVKEFPLWKDPIKKKKMV